MSRPTPKALGVDRYNLYHHLKKLASLELIENHRDEDEHDGGAKISTSTSPNFFTPPPHPTPC